MSAEPEPEPAADPAEDDQSPPPPEAGKGRLKLRDWRVVTAAAAAVVVAATVGVVVGTTGHHGSRTEPASTAPLAYAGLPHTSVDVSPSDCGKGWGADAKPHTGSQVFDLHNDGSSATEVYLTDPKTGKFYAEIEGLAPGTMREMLVDLGSGTYAFECQQEDTDSVTGATVTVPGSVPQGPASRPITVHDLIPPTLDYQKWIQARMAELSADTGKLKKDIDGGDLGAAKRDWLTGHLAYERMGAAYDTFGDADGVINGTVQLDVDPAHAQDFTGFHRIEYGLWHGASAASLRGPAATLDSAARTLQKDWSTQQMDPADMGLRAHEIIENSEQFELTARTDYGSGTNLATASANIDGSRKILDELTPLLKDRDPGLARLQTTLDDAQAYLGTLRHGSTWTPVDRLTRAQREKVNAYFGDMLEQLAPVAAICDVRRTT